LAVLQLSTVISIVGSLFCQISIVPRSSKAHFIKHNKICPLIDELQQAHNLIVSHLRVTFYKEISDSGVTNRHITNFVYYTKQHRRRLTVNPTTPSIDSTMGDRGSSRRANVYQDFLPRGFDLNAVGMCTVTELPTKMVF
jgi:hypothetical protein